MAKATGWQLTLLSDPSGHIAEQYAIKAIPHLFIIGRDGKILAVHSGYGEGSIDQLVGEINAALKTANEPPAGEHPPPPPQ